MTDQRRPAESTHDEAVDLAPAFVLGALDDEAMAAVRAHLASCPEPHDELRELAEMLPVLQASVPVVEPPPSLKDRIMTAAAADLEERARAVEEPAPPAAPTQPSKPSVVTGRARQPRWSWALGIAAVLAIALLGAWNLVLQQQLDASRAYERQVAAVIDAAGQPGAVTAVMAPTAPDGGPSGLATVTSDGTMRIAMRDLAPTAGSEVYEAWLIVGEQPPAPLGGFRVGSDGVGYLEAGGLPAEGGIVLALTREPRPDATAPTSDPVAVGTATAAG